MARVKQSISQRDWSFGEISDDFLERDDTEVIQRSARRIRNMRVTKAGSLTTRPGTEAVEDTPGACAFTEARRSTGEERMIVPTPGGIRIIRRNGLSASISGLPWSEADLCDLWIKESGNEILIGSKKHRPYVLKVDNLSAAPFAFEQGLDGSTAQPYYSFQPGVTIQPSATSGPVTVTASAPAFSAGHVGTIIRYNGQEIQVTGYISPTQVSGTIIQPLPPTYAITVTAGGGPQYSKNDAIEGSTSGATGVVSSVSGDIVTVVLDAIVPIPAVGEFLVGPQTIPLPANPGDPEPPKVVSLALVPPAPSLLWDEQVFSEMRGWPGHAECHHNRLIFTNIPSVPNGFILSQAGSLSNFKLGSADGDAIFETLRGQRLFYTVSAEDLLIFGQDGVYYIGTRNGDPITPTNIEPKRFSSVGTAEIEPVLLEDGVAYVSRCTSKIMAATLAGDQNRYWQDIHLSEYAPHLIRGPKALGSTEGDTDRPEKYLYVTNGDGTLAVMRWQRPPFDESMGWALWRTKGTFIYAGTSFCRSYAIIERDGVRQVERFDDSLYLDAVQVFESLDGLSISTSGLSVWANGRYLGAFDEHDIAGMCYPDSWGPFQIGCAYSQEVDLWPKAIDETARKGFVKQRNGRAAISVKDSTSFVYNGQRRAFYDAFEDLTEPPRLRTEVHKFCNFGRFDHPEHHIRKPEPGPLTIMAVNLEVQG